MPKTDINNALRGYSQPTDNRRRMAVETTTLMTGSDYDLTGERSNLEVRAIPIEKIRKREINEFSESDIMPLAESIRLYGLINPLSVVHHPEEDIYVISAGHRRFDAVSMLHEEEPSNPAWQTIDCCVYEITSDAFKLAQGLPYITAEQEDGIYRDSNLQNRQLSYSDVAHQIRFILNRFEDPAYFERIRSRAAENGVVTKTKADRVRLVVSVLSTQNYEGWSRETIRQYMKIRDSGREDILEKIEKEDYPVNRGYKEIIEAQNQKRRRITNKLKLLKTAVEDFCSEAEDRVYDLREQSELRQLINALEEVLRKNEEI